MAKNALWSVRRLTGLTLIEGRGHHEQFQAR
jgi:hypothetical protein